MAMDNSELNRITQRAMNRAAAQQQQPRSAVAPSGDQLTPFGLKIVKHNFARPNGAHQPMQNEPLG